MTNYYVYYRVDAVRVGALRSEIERLFDEVQKQSGVRGRWLHRRDDAAMYMEVYEDVKDEAAFEAALARASEHLGLERKTERFVCA